MNDLFSPTKWSNTLKQFVANSRRNVLRVFDHFLSGMKTTQSVITFTNSKIKILD